MMSDDGTHALELSVAEIKGMLTSTLARHDQRLDQHEGTLTMLDARLREKGNTIARHDERIKDLEEDSSGRHGRITGTMGLVISAGVALLAIFNAIRIGG